jgi:hypothetical protein
MTRTRVANRLANRERPEPETYPRIQSQIDVAGLSGLSFSNPDDQSDDLDDDRLRSPATQFDRREPLPGRG